MFTFETALWKTTVPDHWTAEDDEDGICFYDPDGVGALQVSCSEKEEGLVEESDLEYFAAELIESDIEYTKVRIGNLAGLLFEYTDDEDEYWKEWYLACDDLFFYLTWNRPEEQGEKEDAIALEIIHTITLLF
ncbi:MAG: hypothetical protein MJA83_08990 [Gammaproteobacteria bacterium]|nr:hypothetical protein [Gammaproteobacteria bacterium]